MSGQTDAQPHASVTVAAGVSPATFAELVLFRSPHGCRNRCP